MPYFIFFFLISPLCFAQTEKESYQFIKKISLHGDGRWDYLKMDEESNRLFVSHQDRVHIIDLKTDQAIGEISGLNSIHGIALIKAMKKGYISNGGNNDITIFDYHTFKVIATIPTNGKKADSIMYDKFSNRVFVFNNGSGTAVVIDASTDKVVGEIDLGGAPEFAVSDGKGLIFNNNEDTQEITVIDTKALKVKTRYSLLPNEVPTGLAIDIEHNRLFSVCRKTKMMVVVDATSGKIIQALPIGGGVDAVIYDKKPKLIITSNGEGNATIIKQESADKYNIIQTLTTKKGCRTMVHNAKTHKIYMSGADYENDGKTIASNSFGVFVYGVK